MKEFGEVMAGLILFIAGVAFILYFCTLNGRSWDRTDMLDACEKDLPREARCHLIAVPNEEIGDDM